MPACPIIYKIYNYDVIINIIAEENEIIIRCKYLQMTDITAGKDINTLKCILIINTRQNSI